MPTRWLLIYIASFSQLLPLVAGLPARRWSISPRGLVILWSTLYFIGDATAFTLARRHTNNHFLTYIFMPVQGAVTFWALSLWQRREVHRIAIRLAIPIFWLAWVVLVLTVENTQNFSAVAEPMYSLLGLTVTIVTLLSRSLVESEPLMRRDWFWVCLGLALHFGFEAALTPFAAAYVRTNPAMVVHALGLRAMITLLAFSMIALGVLCPDSSRARGPR